MRLINIEHLCGGEIIGKDIISPENGVLLKASTKFRPAFKEKLLSRGITEIFIDDEWSSGIIPPEAIEQSLRLKLTQNLKKQFDSVQNVMSMDLTEIHAITHSIIDSMNHQDLVLDLMDLKRNDSYTYSHCLNVCIISCAIAKKMGFTFQMLEDIIKGALLHDIGKMVIPKDVLNKPGKLSDEERALLQTHSKLGYDIIKDTPTISAITKVIVLCHHEREDGNGYPLGKDKDLHIAAKIVAIADVFDALISDRPYRQGFPLNMALTILEQEHLNKNVISILQSIVAFFPVGCAVRLNNDCIGLVEQNHSQDLRRPSLRIIYNAKTQQRENERCNLLKEPDLYIVDRINSLPSFITK